MRQLAKIILLLPTLCVTFLTATAQQTEATNRILGTWRSLDHIDGEPQTALTIKRDGDKLSGTAVLRGLTQGNDNNATLELPFSDTKFDGEVLTVTLKFPGPEKLVADWELKLTGDDQAEFKVVRDNDGRVQDGPSFVMKRAKAD